jgi:hypothetical protein
MVADRLQNAARNAVAFAASTAVLGSPSFVRAQGATVTEPVRVAYEAPEGCPTRAELEGALGERLGSPTLARLDELARTLTIVVVSEPGAFRARIELVDRDGQLTSREVTAPTCDQAVHAMALVASIAVRSQAERMARAQESKRETPPVRDEEPVARRSEPISPATPERRSSRALPLASRSEKSSFEREISAGPSLGTGVGPGAAPGLFAGGRLGVAEPVGRSVVLSAVVNDTLERDFAQATARFRIIKGRVELCPFEPSLTSWLRVSPCPGFEAGSHFGRSYADGVRVVEAGSASRLWVAATLAVRLRFRSDSLSVTLGPELILPFRRNRFALSRPDRPLYAVPEAAVAATAAAGFVW